jgi:hypothetical protein
MHAIIIALSLEPWLGRQAINVEGIRPVCSTIQELVGFHD